MRTVSVTGAEIFDPNSLPPGDALVDAIVAGRGAGRPTWVLTHLVVVPRLQQVAYGAVGQSGYVLIQPHEEAVNARGRSFLRPELAVALDAPSEESARLLFDKPHALAQARHLAAAAIHDVLGWPLARRACPGSSAERNVAYHLEYSGRRSARDAVESGRQLWRRLAAWPWWPLGCLGHNRGTLPDEWWTLPLVAANLAAWFDPEAFLREQSRVRQQVRDQAARAAVPAS